MNLLNNDARGGCPGCNTYATKRFQGFVIRIISRLHIESGRTNRFANLVKLPRIRAVFTPDYEHRIALPGKKTSLRLSLLRGIADSIYHTIVAIIPKIVEKCNNGFEFLVIKSGLRHNAQSLRKRPDDLLRFLKRGNDRNRPRAPPRNAHDFGVFAVSADDHMLPGKTGLFHDSVNLLHEGTGGVRDADFAAGFLFPFVHRFVNRAGYSVGTDHDGSFRDRLQVLDARERDDAARFQIVHNGFVMDDRSEGINRSVSFLRKLNDRIHGPSHAEAEAGCFCKLYRHAFVLLPRKM